MQTPRCLYLLVILLPLIMIINAKGTEYRKMRLLKLKLAPENSSETPKKVEGDKESGRSPSGTISSYSFPSYTSIGSWPDSYTSDYDYEHPSYESAEGAEGCAERAVEDTHYGSHIGSGSISSTPSAGTEDEPDGESDYYVDASSSGNSGNQIPSKRRMSFIQDENGLDGASITSPTFSAPTVTMTADSSAPSTSDQSFSPHRKRPKFD